MHITPGQYMKPYQTNYLYPRSRARPDTRPSHGSMLSRPNTPMLSLGLIGSSMDAVAFKALSLREAISPISRQGLLGTLEDSPARFDLLQRRPPLATPLRMLCVTKSLLYRIAALIRTYTPLLLLVAERWRWRADGTATRPYTSLFLALYPVPDTWMTHSTLIITSPTSCLVKGSAWLEHCTAQPTC